MQRIGVFVCWCGSNIAGTVDVKQVAEMLKHEPGVVFSTDYQYMCSESGQNLIKDAIKEHGLTGVVICSCSPRMHENTFRKAAASVGLNPYMVEIANVREQCSWIHKDMPVATAKAVILGRAAIAKVHLNAPLTAGESPVTKRALVIGGGIAGIQTALDIAEAGFPVDIVEKSPTIGGKMAQLDKTFPTLDCAACILTPKMVEASQQENINIYAYSEVDEVKGFVGNFTVKIRRKARFIKEDLCTGCGLCTEKCPMKKVPNEFNLGMDNRSAVYIPFAQAVPKVATIDANYCIKKKTGKCGLCSTVCGVGAIDYDQKDEILEEKYGAIVVATGFNPISVEKFDEFAYAQSPDVVTSLEYERLMNAAGPTNGTLLRPSDKQHPHTIVFVQCVGSRCDAKNEKGKQYCSKVCCMYTAKHAMLTREKYPDTDVYVFYIDVRTPGKNFDEFYRRAVEQYGVDYIKGMVGKVAGHDGKLLVQGSDLINGRQVKIDADLVVLAGDMVTSSFGAMRDPDAYAAIMRGIKSRLGVYAVYGNHDVDEPLLGGFTYAGRENALRNPAMEGWVNDCGWKLLTDEVTRIPELNGLVIAGRRDESRPGEGLMERADLEDLLKDVDPEESILLLQHEPSDLDDLDECGVDLSVSGHTHDGQIFPGNIITRILEDQSYGMKDWGEATAIVTSGVGYYGPPIRVCTISEIVVIDLV